MSMALSLKRFLSAHHVPYTLLEHPYAEGSFGTAKAANIPTSQLAKAVLFRDEDFNYTLAVVPACNKVRRYTMDQIFAQHMELADEEECVSIFNDCSEGAIPCFGQAYKINVIWDDELVKSTHLWMEAGDHQHLISIKTSDFVTLMDKAMHDHISSEKHYHPPPKKFSEPYSNLGLN